MKKSIVLLFVLLLALPAALFPQKKVKPNTPPAAVSDTERRTSATFADGVKEFYLNNLPAAEEQFYNILQQNPKHDPSLFMLAKIKTAQNEKSAAAHLLEQAAKINTKNEWYREALATIYDELGEYQKAAHLWKQLSEQKPQIETYLLRLADAYLKQQKYTEVIKVYDKLEVLLGFDETVTQAKVEIWLFLNQVDKAANEYAKLTKESPNNVYNYIKAGDIYLTNNELDKAYGYYQRAAKVNANNPTLHFSLAEYWRLVGNTTARLQSLLLVFKNPDFPIEEKLPVLKPLFSSYVMRGAEAGITYDAMEQLLKALTDAHPQAVEGWANWATLQFMAKQFAPARANLEKVLALDQSRFTIWEDYFFVLSQLGDFQAIAEKADLVTELFPTNAMLLYTVGLALLQQEEPKRALDFFQQAAVYAFEPPLVANIYQMTANAYDALGDHENAEKFWEMAKRKGYKK